MPAVDSNYQNPQWIEGYCRADAICSYTDWAIQIMRELSGGRVRVIGNTSPAANDNFKPVDNKFEHKKKYGLENFKIVGTVMRNQKRKLFPDLFQAFRLFLDGSERKDVLLYCHTGYPDRTPWNIPELLNEYGIAHKVLFTYKCNPAMGGCGFSFPSFFGDYRKVCPRCRGFSATTADVHNGVDDNFLCDLYNLFDLYIQYAALESFGMPAVEAGACGTPVMIIDFSGMSEIVRKLEGIPLPPLTLNKELETGRLWAIPDNNWTALKLEEFFNLSDEQRAERSKKTRENYLTHFSYDRSAQVLANHFGSLNMEELERRWYSPPRIKEPAQLVKQCESMSNLEFTKWCIYEVMGEPSYLYGYWHSRMLKDLNFGCHTMGIGGNYFNDNAMMCSENNLKNFTRQDLYNICEGFGKNRNYWERVRKEVIK
jgi:glycosyltransferase involved in cell wall biosynthesis